MSAADVQESLDKQMANVRIITVLWRHYFAENHDGDFADCTDPSCAPFTDEVRNARA